MAKLGSPKLRLILIVIAAIGGGYYYYSKRTALPPAEFITADGFHLTDACLTYLQPLIEGEDPPPYRNGLPDYVSLKKVTVAKKLGAFTV